MSEKKAAISFLGDISFNDAYRETAHNFDQYFGKIADLLSNSDYVIGNLECFAESDTGVNKKKVPRLSTSEKMLRNLSKLNLSAVGLANNHVYDNLEDGFTKTISILDELGISYFGAGAKKSEAEKPHQFEVNGLHFTILSYVTGDTNPNIPENAGVFLNFYSEDKIIKDITDSRADSDYIILYLHWGGKYERALYPGLELRASAEKLFNAGADLIVGHHSHTLQPYEIIDSKYVFYSLGNFCFADVHTDGKIFALDKRKNFDSMILNLHFTKDGYSVELIPFINNKLSLEPNDRPQKRLKKRNKFFEHYKKSALFRYFYKFKFLYYDTLIYFIFYDKRSIREKLNAFSIGKIKKFLRRR